MQRAEKQARKFKEDQQREEERMEKEFRKRMLEKFAEDEKIEQMNAQKKRMRELEHKREVILYSLYFKINILHLKNI